MKPGQIGWVDLTVAEAGQLKDFYAQVLNVPVSGIDMGGYEDFCLMQPDGEDAVAGVCHARGSNVGLPPVWMVYFTIADLDASLAAVAAQGGTVILGPKPQGDARYAVIRDPAGAVCALYQPGPDAD